MRKYFPSPPDFENAAKSAQIIPVYRQLLSDHLTPVMAFEVLGRDPNSFLLESVVGGENIGRYSFIAAGPKLVYQAASGRAVIQQFGQPQRETVTTDPLGDMWKLLPVAKYHHDPHLPAFTGGLVGYA